MLWDGAIKALSTGCKSGFDFRPPEKMVQPNPIFQMTTQLKQTENSSAILTVLSNNFQA